MKTRVPLLSRLCGLTLTVLLSSAFSAKAAIYSWTNTAGGNWNVGANWNPNGVPGSADTANITNSGNYAVTLVGTADVNSLTVGGATSGTQTLRGNGSLTGASLIATNALINGGGLLSLTNLTFTGNLGVATGAVFTVGGVTLNAQVTIQNGGNMAIVEGATAVSSLGQSGASLNTNYWLWVQDGARMAVGASLSLYAPMTNSGTSTIGTITIYNNTSLGEWGGLVNLTDGVINLIDEDGGGITGQGGFDYLVNQGTITENNSLDANISVDLLTNQGAVTSVGGAGLEIGKFNGLGSLTGSFTAGVGTSIEFTASTSPGTSAGSGLTLGGGGQYQFGAGLLTLPTNTLPNVQYTGGAVQLGAGFQGGAITNLGLNGSSLSNSLPVTGTLAATNGILSGSYLVASGAVLDVTGTTLDAQITVENGGQMVTLAHGAELNSGLGQNGNSNDTNYWLWLQAGAQLNCPGGGLVLWAPMTNSGTCNLTNTLSIYNDNTAGQDGGLVNLAAGVINLFGGAGITGYSGSDYVLNQGMINVSSGDISTIDVDNFTNAATLNIQHGTLQLEGAGVVLQPSETLDFVLNSASDFGSIVYNSGPGLNLAQAGTLQLTFNGAYVPALSNSFQLLSADSSGTFAGAFGNFSSPPGAIWQASYSATSLVLTDIGQALPSLGIVASPPNMTLSWTTNGGAFVLNRTASLVPPITWIPVTNGITVNGTNNTITVNAGSGNQYYALIAQ